jgi:hypothetical protein
VKYLPAWVPGAGFKRWAEEAQADFSRMMQTPFYEVKEKHVSRIFCDPLYSLISTRRSME